ncbi:uncharacterized protein FIESC28_07651 [Fusarium coffeatum]|uniref:Heterokaryon incompatibility domain-containing protein n=1 Tax=Fusarium coffeatum TaxID=231269 RepID=A0A366RCE5_9HYPO|nr:uncharacterized protein FIESC28_07651 [Fusarium coffeatum]RBR14522.1 hypothetical protein FIESC28_07651 [Fusarium coffeatum]
MSDPQILQYSSVELDNASTEIRLLDLHPPQIGEVDDRVASNWNKPLICRLYKTCITDPCPYKALSYVWGEGRKTESIWVVSSPGKSGEASIPITESLDTALRHLRKPDETVTLWIDQICINQADNKEKGEQVAMMGRIYSEATQVIVWLGPAADGSDGLMNAWQDVGQKARDFGLDSYMTPQGFHAMSAIMRNEDPTDETTRRFQVLLQHTVGILAPLLRDIALKAWFERPYFSRVWIIQEFCLCPDTVFVCGTRTVAVELIKLAVTILQMVVSNMLDGQFPKLQEPELLSERLADISEEPITRLFSCRTRQQNGRGDELHMLLRRMFVGHDTRATQHRDRVFALLGLAVDVEELGIQVDYESPTERVLAQTARGLIEKAGRVDILCCSQFPKLPDFVGLPSWVPDWRSNLRPSFYNINERMNKHIFFASGNNSIVEIVKPTTESPFLLGLRGYTVDVIDKVAEGEGWIDLSWDPARLLSFLAQVDALWQESMEKPIVIDGPTESRKVEARWRVPIGDLYKTEDGDEHRATPDIARSYRRCVQELKMFYQMTLGEDELQDIENWETPRDEDKKINYDWDMRKMEGKRPFLTQMGYIGMGPIQGKPGDLVVAFCGGHIPFVLRPEPDGQDMFSFVGEAYCDGIMDGEVTTKEKQTFWLV